MRVCTCRLILLYALNMMILCVCDIDVLSDTSMFDQEGVQINGDRWSTNSSMVLVPIRALRAPSKFTSNIRIMFCNFMYFKTFEFFARTGFTLGLLFGLLFGMVFIFLRVVRYAFTSR